MSTRNAVQVHHSGEADEPSLGARRIEPAARPSGWARRPWARNATPSGDGPSTLEARGVRVAFGGITALDGIDLVLAQGEILGLIGPNGAGKSTLVNALTGYQRLTAGVVTLDGRDITHLAAHRRPRAGVVRTFQATRAFRGLTVAENIEVSALRVERSRRAARSWTRTVLEEADLWSRADGYADELSTGDAQRLGVARAIALRPRFLLLDEPAAGLNDREGQNLVALLVGVAARTEMGVLVIEHNLDIVRAVSHRIHVIDDGRTIGVGTPEEVGRMPAVLKAYLGDEGMRDVAS